MSDFPEYVRHRRRKLLKELAELDAAERLYRESERHKSEPAFRFISSAPEVAVSQFHFQRRPETIKAMILSLLEESSPDGLTALELLAEIQARWKPDLERTSLSPQLTRLGRSGQIANSVGKWFLQRAEPEEVVPPEESDELS